MTGEEFVQSMKVCTNPECVDFGKYILPSDALFCPRCGQKLKDSRESNFENNIFADNDISDLLFPVHGVTLGKTTIQDVNQQYLKFGFGDLSPNEYNPNDNVCFYTLPDNDLLVCMKL